MQASKWPGAWQGNLWVKEDTDWNVIHSWSCPSQSSKTDPVLSHLVAMSICTLCSLYNHILDLSLGFPHVSGSAVLEKHPQYRPSPTWTPVRWSTPLLPGTCQVQLYILCIWTRITWPKILFLSFKDLLDHIFLALAHGDPHMLQKAPEFQLF